MPQKLYITNRKRWLFAGPLLSDGLKQGTLKALKVLPSVITLVYVSVYVCICVIKQQVTIFNRLKGFTGEIRRNSTKKGE